MMIGGTEPRGGLGQLPWAAVLLAAGVALLYPAAARAEVRLPLGLFFGQSAKAATTQLSSKGATIKTGRVVQRRSRSGRFFHKQRLKAKLPSGELAGVQLDFVADRLARVRLFARNRRALLSWALRQGPATHWGKPGRIAWVDNKLLQWARCKPGRCEAASMLVFVGPAASRAEAERFFRRKAPKVPPPVAPALSPGRASHR